MNSFLEDLFFLDPKQRERMIDTYALSIGDESGNSYAANEVHLHAKVKRFQTPNIGQKTLTQINPMDSHLTSSYKWSKSDLANFNFAKLYGEYESGSIAAFIRV